MTKVDRLQGALDMLILQTLSHDPMRGFAIALRIRQITDEVIQIGEGSLYPALYRMELKGWIKAEPTDACRSLRASHGSGTLGLLYSSSSGGQSRSEGGATS